jgi:hypothetical protein
VSWGAFVVTFRLTTPCELSFFAALKPWLHQGSLLPQGNTSAIFTLPLPDDDAALFEAPPLLALLLLLLPHAATSTAARATTISPATDRLKPVRVISTLHWLSYRTSMIYLMNGIPSADG